MIHGHRVNLLRTFATVAHLRGSGRIASHHLKSHELALLRAGPWAWPHDHLDREWVSRAHGLRAPTAAPGQVLLLAASPEGDRGAVWALDADPGDLGTVGLVPELVDSWRGLCDRLPQQLPLTWRRVEPGPNARALRLGTWLGGPGTDDSSRDAPLSGASYQLPLAMSAVSRHLDRPLPEDVAMTGTLTYAGTDWLVGAVDGIRAKVGALLQGAPQVRRVLVPAANEEEARAAAGLGSPWPNAPGLAVVPVRTLGDAIDACFGLPSGPERKLQFERWFVDAVGKDRRHERIAFDLHLLLLDPRRRVTGYASLQAAAEAALATFSGIPEHHKAVLAWTIAVCQRHDANGGRMPLLGHDRLRPFPPEMKHRYLADLIQQCHDTAVPPAEDVLALARAELGDLLRADADLNQAYDEQLKALGAFARLEAVTGHLSEALRRQCRILDAFQERPSWNENASFQLSEIFRLAGLVKSVDDFHKASALDEDFRARGGYVGMGGEYVEFARLRCALQLADVPGRREALATFSRSTRSKQLAAAAWRVLASYDTAPPRPGLVTDSDRAAAIQQALIDLDRAVRSDADADVGRALMRLRELEPGVMTHVTAAATGDLAQYVARHFPY